MFWGPPHEGTSWAGGQLERGTSWSKLLPLVRKFELLQPGRKKSLSLEFPDLSSVLMEGPLDWILLLVKRPCPLHQFPADLEARFPALGVAADAPGGEGGSSRLIHSTNIY